MMRILFFICLVVATMAICLLCYASAQQSGVTVELKNAQDQSIGTATLFKAGKGVRIKLDLKNPRGPHDGDMNNFIVRADGTATATLTNSRVKLGADSHSLFTKGGTSLVIHAKADDMKTDPSGNSGDRIACGVIAR